MIEVVKDPDAVLDYEFVWCAPDGQNDPCHGWLGGDTIIGSSWSFNGGDGELVVNFSTVADFYDCDDVLTSYSTVTRAWLSGGSPNRDYEITNRITTLQGRTDDRTIKIMVRDR